MFSKQHTVNLSRQVERYDNSRSLGRRGDNLPQLSLYRALMAAAVQTQLTQKQRDALLLYYQQEMTIYQIAEELHIHPSSVSRRLKGARKAIKVFADTCLLAGLDKVS